MPKRKNQSEEQNKMFFIVFFTDGIHHFLYISYYLVMISKDILLLVTTSIKRDISYEARPSLFTTLKEGLTERGRKTKKQTKDHASISDKPRCNSLKKQRFAPSSALL